MSVHVVIVGGGTAGACTAAALAHHGVDARLLDAPDHRSTRSDDWDLRVFAIAPGVKNLLERLGAWEKIDQTRVSACRRMRVWHAASAGAVRFEASEIGLEHLAYIVENRQLVQALRAVCPHRLEAHFVSMRRTRDGWQISLRDDPELHATTVVAADGARSKVREQAGIRTSVRHYGQTAIVAHLHTELPHDQAAYQVFLPSGPFALLPLADGRSSLVWSVDDPQAQELLQLAEADFEKELNRVSARALGALRLATERVSFPLRAQRASCFAHRDGVALVGDAARTVHPLAGQGANLGMLDAAALAQSIAEEGLRGLIRYDRWRRSESAITESVLDLFADLFRSTGRSGAWLGHGLRIFDATGFARRMAIRRACALSGELPTLVTASKT